MARYDAGHEDFRQEAAKARQYTKAMDELIAKERAYAQELGIAQEQESKASSQRQVRQRIQREGREVAEREERVAGRTARVYAEDTKAIERNVQARERLARVQRQQAQDFSRALRGGRDPLFGRASAFGDPSQYRLRRELGIGQGRAANLQSAVRAGLRPEEAGRAALGPATRAQAAAEAVARADIAYATAQRERRNAVRRADQAAVVSADANLEAARAARQAARLELESSRNEAAARAEVARAAQAEAASRAQAAAAAKGAPGQGIIPRTRGEFGRYGGAFFGEQPYAPVGREQARARPDTRGVPATLYGGNQQYDEAFQKRTEGATKAAAAERELQRAAQAEQLAMRSDVARQATAARSNLTNEINRQRAATRFSAVELGTASQAMTRHGALTSEFIMAAARGETTLRELGNQALVTAGKFAGWTLAASAVFGLVGALGQMGHGAIVASSGVGQLKRVINDVDAGQATQSFRDQAAQFNVPIEDSADAIYRMGQVFHNQADATKAAEAALYSFKTGEVDVATSTQNLIAIVNGFGLGADELSSRFDQINQAQNEFGIRIGDTEAGLAKAAGVFRAAGGDFNYLLGLFVAIQKATGRSGTEIGTGIARGVNQIRQKSNIDKLRRQGVDVNPEDFQSTLQSAMRAAQRPGADIQQIATGLLGNQYARLITPVLEDQTRLNQALKDTSPEAAKGSAQRELAQVLGQVDEQIHAIGINLQRLGSALGDTGLGLIPGILLHGLNLGLDVAVRLLDVFDKLPEPLRLAVSLFAQMAIAMRLIRRFGGGDALASRVPSGRLDFLRNVGGGDERLRRQALLGLREQEQSAKNAREAAARSGFGANTRAEFARTQLIDHDRQFAQLQRSGRLPAVGTDERLALDQKRLVLEERALAATRAADVVQQEALEAKRLQIVAEQERMALEATSARNTRAYLLQRGIPIPASFDRPSSGGARYLRPGAGAADQFGINAAQQRAFDARNAQTVVPAFRPPSDMFGINRQLERAGVATTGLTGFINRQRTSLQSWAASQSRLSIATRPLVGATSAALGAASSVTGRVGAASGRIGGLRGAVGGMGSALRELGGSLGALDYALIGFALYAGVLKPFADKLAEDQAQTIRELESAPRSVDAARKQLEQARATTKTSGDQFSVGPANFDKRLGRERLAQGIENFLGLKSLTDENYLTPTETRKLAERIAKNDQEEAARIKRIQQEHKRGGGPVPLQFTEQITAGMRRDADLREKGVISLREFDRRMRDHVVEIQTSRTGDPRALQAARDELEKLNRQQARPTDFHRRFGGAGVEELQSQMTATVGALGSYSERGSRFRIQELGAEYRQIAARLQLSQDPKDIATLQQARDQFYQALTQSNQDQLDSGLLFARSEGSRRAAFARARRGTDAGPRSARTQLTNDMRRLAETRYRFGNERDAIRALGGDRGAELAERGFDKAGDLGVPGAKTAASKIAKLRQRFKADRERIADLRQRVKKDRDDVAEAYERQREDLAKLTDQAYDDRQQGRGINRDLQLSRTQDKGAQAAINVEFAQRELRDARRTYGVHDRRYKQALTAYNNARIQQSQSLLAATEANNSLLQARASGDPVTAAQAAVSAARNTLAALRRSGADPNDIKQALANVISLEIQAAQTVRDRANTIRNLNFQIAQARAEGDPAAQARLAQAQAKQNIAHAKNQEERLQGLLDLVNANNQAEQAARDLEAARYEFLASLTDDPVEQARIERTAAHRAIRGTRGAERYRARARANQADRQFIQAQITSKQEDIDFDLFMENIDRQTAIERYQALLKEKGLTKAMKRDIQRRIKELQKEGDAEASGFGLELGSIRMPTVYDVRRAIGSAQGSRQAVRDRIVSNMQNNVQIYVNDPNAADAVFDAMDRAVGTQLNMALKNAGVS